MSMSMRAEDVMRARHVPERDQSPHHFILIDFFLVPKLTLNLSNMGSAQYLDQCWITVGQTILNGISVPPEGQTYDPPPPPRVVKKHWSTPGALKTTVLRTTCAALRPMLFYRHLVGR